MSETGSRSTNPDTAPTTAAELTARPVAVPSPADPESPATTAPVPESGESAAGLLPDAALVGVALIWGINIPLMKTGVGKLDPFVFNAVRLLISALVLAAFALRERRAGRRTQPDLKFRQVVVYSLIASVLYQLLFLLGIARTTSGNMALIIATVPMWTALLAWTFLGEQLRTAAWIGLLIALTGTVIVALQKGDVSAGSEHLLGNLFVLGAALAWSAGTVYSRPLLTKISPMQLSAASAAMALPFHILFASGNFAGSVPQMQSVSVWLIILYSGVLSTGFALPMWSFGVRHAGAAHASIIQNLIPVIAMLAAWLTRGEAATGPQIFGGVLILTGLIIMRHARGAGTVSGKKAS
ncbi:MAG: DMT family transporter [Planctomycetaceae bacterium]|nr:DMT family transporter [Planctomycetaceae bacterium]